MTDFDLKEQARRSAVRLLSTPRSQAGPAARILIDQIESELTNELRRVAMEWASRYDVPKIDVQVSYMPRMEIRDIVISFEKNDTPLADDKPYGECYRCHAALIVSDMDCGPQGEDIPVISCPNLCAPRREI